MNSMTWVPECVPISLPDREVHVWQVDLDFDRACLPSLEELLSRDELARASRLYFESDRRRHIAGRAALRGILGHYLRTPAAALSFRYNDFGKPALDCDTDLFFNLSHSGSVALIAMTRGIPIGVDVEFMRLDVDFTGIAARFFSDSENAVLLSLPLQQRCRCFFDCWTRKEAYIKALGEGLSIPLDRFDVSNAPGEPARLIVDRADPLMSQRWTIRELPVRDGHVGAVAVEATAISWRLFDWSSEPIEMSSSRVRNKSQPCPSCP